MKLRLRKESEELPRLAWSLATLATAGFSLVLFFQIAWMGLQSRADFSLSNVLGVPNRNVLLLTLLAGMSVPTIGALLVNRYRRSVDFELVHRYAMRLAPLSLAFLLPSLYLPEVSQRKPLFYLVALSLFGLAARQLVGASIAAWASFTPAWPVLGRARSFLEPLRALPLLLVAVSAVGVAWFLGRAAVTQHHLIQSLDDGLAIAENLMSNLAHGRLFRAPIAQGGAGGSYLSHHADFIALLFLPLYRLHPGAESLLWLQAALVALSVLPLFGLAARLLGKGIALWVSLVFLSLAPLQGAVLYSFSWTPALCLFSFTLYYAIFADRLWLVALALPCTLASTESGPFVVFSLGAFLAASGGRARFGMSLCAMALTVFALDTWLATRVSKAEATPIVSGLQTLFSNPVYFVLDLARATKLTALLHALAPLALQPLRGWVLLLPGLFSVSGSTAFWPAAREASTFALVWIPGSLLALLVSMQRMRALPQMRPWYAATIVTVTITALSHSYDFGLLLRRNGSDGTGPLASPRSAPGSDQRYRDLRAVVDQLPPSASVVATPYMLPYVSSRPDAFDVRRPYEETDFLFFSSRELVGNASEQLRKTFDGGRYTLLANSGEFYLFRRGAESERTTELLRTLGLRSGANKP